MTAPKTVRTWRTWRYSAPNENHEGWFVAFLDEVGCLAILSDFGNYTYRWNAPGGTGCEFRQFLTRCDADYILRKLSRADKYYGEATVKAVKDWIVRSRREGRAGFSMEDAREEWDRIDQCQPMNELEFAEWLRETSIEDAWEFSVFDHPGQARAFMERVWPRLMDLLKRDLAAEQEAA